MKRSIILILLAMLATISCNQKQKPQEIVRMEMKIEGMHCTSCEQAVANAVVGTKGTIEVFVRYKDGYAVTRFDKLVVSAEDIVNAIEKKGYKVVSTKISADNP